MEVLIQQINDLVSEIQNDTNRTKLPLLSEKLIQLSKLYGESKREMNELIDQIDAFISKDSFLITDKEMDQAMENWNRLFDISNSEQEANEIDQLKHNNLRASHGLLMKAEKDDKGKNVYTDTTLNYALDIKFQDKEVGFITSKYKFKVIPNKIKVLEHKINFVKKIKGA